MRLLVQISLPGQTSTPTKEKNKISAIVLNEIKKNLMRRVIAK